MPTVVDEKGIPKIFRRTSPLNVNFDWTDFASGAGYVLYYAGDVKLYNSVTGDIQYNILADRIFKSHYGACFTFGTSDVCDGVYRKVIDIDFDILMNMPQTLKGRALIDFTARVLAVGAGNGFGCAIFRLRKWDGTTETEIAATYTYAGTLQGQGGVTGQYYKTDTTFIDVPTTHIKKGEYIRLTVEGWVNHEAGGTRTDMWIVHDPKGRTTSAAVGLTWDALYPTELEISLPFKINL